jgi:hypothetical protein
VPPRFAYWTILIDNAPTAFRARDREELLPTLAQIKRTNQNAELKWFAQGRLWDSPEAQHESWKKPKEARERRDRDWRPGGQHKDPRARFDKEAQRRKKREQRERFNASPRPQPNREWKDHPPRTSTQNVGRPSGQRPWNDRGPRPHGQRSAGAGKHAGWKPRVEGPRNERKPWQNRPQENRPPRNDRQSRGAWRPKPPGNRTPWRPNTPDHRRKRRDDEPPDHE